ncbi:MAG: carbon-nitrogen hydrolase family protein [Clostridiales bacterium]|nr:carbon-nitrogen hydrolase family protein [Clostridiales bacterium]
MRLAAYQFGVTGDVKQNMSVIVSAVRQAAEQKADLVIFPECAVSGYPPKNIAKAENIDFSAVDRAIKELKELSDSLGISIITGTAFFDSKYYNRAYLFSPGQTPKWYGKRALYGWDEDNFTPGSEDGIFRIGGLTVGVRICYEIRFPEYFRELYRAHTDLDIVLFYDVSDTDDAGRYEMIKSHIVTRAVENVTPFLSVNATAPFQTAPTCFVDASGKVPAECARNKEELLIYDFEVKALDFGEKGRVRYSDLLTGRS